MAFDTVSMEELYKHKNALVRLFLKTGKGDHASHIGRVSRSYENRLKPKCLRR